MIPPSSDSASGARTASVLRVRDGLAARADDWLAAEEPLEIRLMWGDRVQRLAVTMRTPGHDTDLAVGFLVGEGVIRSPEDVLEAFHAPIQGGQTDPNIVAVRLASGVTFDAGRLERHVYTTSSCGVCGKASLEAVGVITGAPLAPGPRFTPEAIHTMPALLREAQAVFEQTGGLHAAALFSVSGDGASCDLLRVREDVGRHNAVDKLVGSYFASGETVPPEAVVLVSGRASFELAQKALVAGISVLAAVGAPSSLAADLAREHGMTLLGFVRDGRFNVYAGRERLDLSASGDR